MLHLSILLTTLLLPFLTLSIPYTYNAALSIPYSNNATMLVRKSFIEPAPLEQSLADSMSCCPTPPKGYHASHQQNAIYAAQKFCRELAPFYSPYVRPMEPVAATVRTQSYPGLEHLDGDSDLYRIDVVEIEECEPERLKVDILHPNGAEEGMEEDTGLCESILYQ